jgi:hypothetical protein
MNTIQESIILTQKQRAIVFCVECHSLIFVTISSDGAWYGAHYFGLTPVTIQDKFGWVCYSCWENAYLS